MQDAMVVLTMLLLAQAQHAQGGGHRAFAGGQDGTNHQHLGMFPDALGKQRCEPYNQMPQGDRHGKQRNPLLAKEWSLAYTACRFAFKDLSNGQSPAK